MNNTNIKINDITIGSRHRKDMGDLDSLAQSIQEIGLLQAIGVRPDHELVFGERRLRACQSLGWDTIPARVIDIPAIVLGEYHENCDRKDFTPSELVAIVESLRAYKHGGDRKSDQFLNSADDRLTTEKALGQVGLKKDTYCRAKRVVEQGVPELIEAMDSGKLSIFAASEIAQAKPEEQLALLERKPNEDRWTGCGVKRQLRRLRRDTQREALSQTVAMPQANEAVRIYHGPFQKLEQLAGLAPASAKLVCTDIPYDGEFLPQVSDLAEMAGRVLVDGGLLVMYCGQYWLPEVMRRLGEHLTYRWTCAGVWQGDGNVIHPLGITSQWKPILVFSKGDWAKTGRCSDVFRMHSKEKECHDWQQPLGDVEKLVEYFSAPGDLVVDPCGGGFTTAIACHRLGRRSVGCDIDKAAVALGQERLAKEREPAVAIKVTLRANTVTHGDCIDLIPSLPDGSINLCLTSPPYAEQRKGLYASIPEEEYPEFTLRWMAALEPKLAEDGSVLLVIRPDLKDGEIKDYVLRTRLALRDAGWHECEELIWHKPDGGACMGSSKRPRRTYEHILWFSKTTDPHIAPKVCGRWSESISYRGSTRFGFGGKSPIHSGQNTERRSGQTKLADVIRVPVTKIEKGVQHPAMFPTELAEILIKTFCPEGGTVLDPFAGSGTTLIAAANLGRNWYGFDISDEYCELARQRLGQQEGGLSQAG